VKRYPFMQVDAFTRQRLSGNPCAVVMEADGLDDDTMQAIAREMNLSETAFVFHSRQADYKVRYFTPAEEIPMAGHPTLATTYALVASGRLALAGHRTRLELEMQIGPVPVEIIASTPELGEQGIDQIVMTQRKPIFMREYNASEVLPAFGLPAESVVPGYPIQTVSTGTPQLMVPIRSLGDLQKARLDLDTYQQLRAAGDFFSPHLFYIHGITPAGQTFARHFAPPPDVYEDPFTGSATGGMAAYLWRYKLIDSPRFVAEQGHWLDRPGQAQVEVLGPPDNIEAVRVGGQAVGVLVGELIL
jgi:trans-2,3-dihydro-3-hydroxyanthranilate isomerase